MLLFESKKDQHVCNNWFKPHSRTINNKKLLASEKITAFKQQVGLINSEGAAATKFVFMGANLPTRERFELNASGILNGNTLQSTISLLSSPCLQWQRQFHFSKRAI